MTVAADLKPGEVYVRSRGESGEGRWEVMWLDPTSRAIRRVIRKDEKLARALAEKKRQDIARGEAEAELPFGDDVAGMDGTLGGSWLELLWAGAITVASNPGNEVTQRALSSVAKAAQAAKAYVRRDQLFDKDEDVDDPSFWREVGENLKPRLVAAGVAADKVAEVLTLIRGGKKEEAA